MSFIGNWKNIFSFYIYLIGWHQDRLVRFFSFPLFTVSSMLINSLRGHSVPSFSGKRCKGFSAWSFTKKEKFLHKGNKNWLLFRAEGKVNCPDAARGCPTSSQGQKWPPGPAQERPGASAAGGTRGSAQNVGMPSAGRYISGCNASETLKMTTRRQTNTDIWKAIDPSVQTCS